MSRRPTLDELRNRVQKERHREIGNALARRFARPSAVYGTWLAVRLRLSANHVTAMAMAANLVGACAIGTGLPIGFATGVILLHVGFWLDHVDGQVARWHGSSTLNGVFYDYMMHHASTLALGFGLGFGLCRATGDPIWCIAGFAAALGWSLLSLHNDCRYKAFFQRLKREKGSFRVDGGAGGRPAPPARWPTRGHGVITWPAYKLCEPHVVLVTLTALAALPLISARVWLLAWQVYITSMAVAAPLLAAARTARAVTRGTVEREFNAWFRPLDKA